MTDLRGREALLTAFDRLFDRAAGKLNFTCSPEEREEARRSFSERFEQALEMVEKAGVPALPEPMLTHMESAIDELSPAVIASHLAAVPLAVHMQEVTRQIVVRAAEQKVLEHFVSRADDAYGGN
jgi:uncharacterized protein YqgV (UPF0045/DUF77 family)